MEHVIFYDKDTKEIMGRGSYSNPDDIPTQFPHIETTEEIVNDAEGIYEIYDDAGDLKVRKIGIVEREEPTLKEIMDKLTVIETDVKSIKIGAK